MITVKMMITVVIVIITMTMMMMSDENINDCSLSTVSPNTLYIINSNTVIIEGLRAKTSKAKQMR